MATAVLVGKEATHGTIASVFVPCPCAFKPVLKQSNKVLDEDRNGQDRNFTVIKGQKYEDWSVGDSAIYHDSIGLWLASAMGAPTKSLHSGETTVFDNQFTFLDDPTSLSFKWQQPRRYTQAYQSLYGVVDKFSLKYAADGDLTWSASGVAMGETEITQQTFAFTSTRPFSAWEGTVLLGGVSYAHLISGDLTFTRNRKPFYTVNNSADPNSMSIGSRMVEFNLVLDFVTKSDYDDYKAASIKSLDISWVDADVILGSASNPTFEVNMAKTAYEEGEQDNDPDLPQLKIKGKALYDNTSASLAVVTVTSTTDYTA